MAPFTNIPFAPAELSYLYTSLSLVPPIRPDGRSPTDFRPLLAETDILPTANGSARICFADGTEAIVGVKAEVEKTAPDSNFSTDATFNGDEETDPSIGKGRSEWLEVAIEIPGTRDDDQLPIFLSQMLSEALLADRTLKDRLYINRRFHWRLYIDVLLLSQALSYPLPLLSLTTHLALLSARLPSLVSEKDEDPLFNDDWEASKPIFPQVNAPSKGSSATPTHAKPAITLLVISIGQNILFDPSREELAVADSVFAISVTQEPSPTTSSGRVTKLLSIRTIDPPSRLTGAGVPISQNPAVSGSGGSAVATAPAAEARVLSEFDQGQTVWRPPRGGVPRTVIAAMIKAAAEEGGVASEVMDGLAGVEI